MKRYVQIVLVVMVVGIVLQSLLRSLKEKKTHGHHHTGFGHKHDGSVFSIDFYAYASGIRSWNPKFKAAFAMICLILCIACDNFYVAISSIILMGYITMFMGGLPFRRYLSLMTIPIVFLLFGSFAIAVGFALSPIGQYNLHLGFFYIYCSDASLREMALLIVKAFGAVSAMYMLTLSTPASEIIAVLRSIHIPKIFVELMSMIYRYIFLMMDTQCRMKNSAESRLGYCDFKTSCLSFGQVASNLLVVSLKKGNTYYQALEARCYDGELLFLEEDKEVTAKQVAGAAACVAFMLLVWQLTR